MDSKNYTKKGPVLTPHTNNLESTTPIASKFKQKSPVNEHEKSTTPMATSSVKKVPFLAKLKQETPASAHQISRTIVNKKLVHPKVNTVTKKEKQKQKQKLPCSYCGNTFSHPSSLSRHIHKQHSTAIKGSKKCNECDTW